MGEQQADGDDYWLLFASVRKRLNDLYEYRLWLGSEWQQMQFETFAFKFRMFLEEFSLFIRAALVERGQLSKKDINAYGPGPILQGAGKEVSNLRFITTKSLQKEIHSDEEFSMRFEYKSFIKPDVKQMDKLYGRLGNFTHPSIKADREELAKAVTSDCFEFFKQHQAIFRRHTLERSSTDPLLPPSDLSNMLFIVGATDAGNDIFIRCEGSRWIDRSPKGNRYGHYDAGRHRTALC
ncbi:hypothetical protein [Pontixanthobacter sp.]|uniref:hypothetical protein n=1 Tax=Pontixanthobacter sp. TaxID=2792078 RepID=UPI003C7D3944